VVLGVPARREDLLVHHDRPLPACSPHNIQVNAIAPGWIETDMTAPVRTTPMNDEILARTPAGRWGQPEEVAGAAVYLASRAADFVTGDTIRVDGGYAIR